MKGGRRGQCLRTRDCYCGQDNGPQQPCAFPSTRHHWLKQSLTRRLSSNSLREANFWEKKVLCKRHALHSLLMYFQKWISTWHTCDTCNMTQHCVPHESGKWEASKELWMQTLVVESKKRKQLFNWTQTKKQLWPQVTSQLIKPHTSQTAGEESSIASPYFRNVVTSGLELHKHEHPYYNLSLENRLFEGKQIQIETVWFPEQFIH